MLTILLGGARSGKSALAVRAAVELGTPVTFIATASILDDDEFAKRIELHRAQRPTDWQTIEEPDDLVGALARALKDSTVVIDCLTLWVSNLMEHGHSDSRVLERALELADATRCRSGATFVVTNEVGSGIVPGDYLSRRFRDLLGAVNATLASRADDAFLVIAGRVLSLGLPDLVLRNSRGSGS